jgi:penicillin G amidase
MVVGQRSIPRRGRLRILLAIVAVVGLAGAIAPKGVAAGDHTRITIYRDEYGVPHVYSDTIAGLFTGAGYATGQDRLWQADLLRRVATGTLSELLGPGSGGSNIASDQFFRLFTGGTSHRAALYASLSSLDQRIITSFRNGINRWIADASASGRLPVEYGAFGVTPRTWTADDIVATAMLSIFEFGANGGDELSNAAQLQTLIARLGSSEAAAVFADAHWTDDPSAPTTIPGAQAAAIATAGAAARASLPYAAVPQASAAASRARAMVSGMRAVLSRLGLAGVGHSNAIAVSHKLSATGAPLLLGGPQIGYSLPQGFMEIGLHGAGFDATGVTLAGNPGVQIGAGNGHAWTVTSGGDDDEDFYAEITDPSGHPGQYFFDGAWQPFACSVETISVRGSHPVTFNACFSVHGPVLGSSDSVAFTLRDATRENLAGSINGFFGLDRAESLHDFVKAGRQIVGSLNLTYIDRDGNIAYAHVGSVPIRPAGDNPFLPHPGDGSDEWQGFIPTSQLPLVVNPDRGWLTNWNNKPQAGWANASSGFWDWGPVQRVQVIMRQLAALTPHSATVHTLETINMTTGETTESPVGVESNMFVQAVLAPMLAHLRSTADPRLPGAISLLSGWDQLRVDADQNGSYDNPAVTVFDAWYAQFVADVFAPKTGSRGSAGAVDDNTVADLVLRLYQGAHASLPLHDNYLGSESLRHATTRALVEALDALTSQFGTSDVTQWLTPDVYIHYAPLGAGSVPDIIWMNRGTYNQILQAGHDSKFFGENVVAPGQSGDVRSPHFADQLSLYASWTYKPMRLTRHDLQGHITSTTVLFTG